MNREELNAEIKMVDLAEALDAAKERVFGGDTSEEAHKALKDAEWAMAEHRIGVRAARGPVAGAPEDGVATPEALHVTPEAG